MKERYETREGRRRLEKERSKEDKKYPLFVKLSGMRKKDEIREGRKRLEKKRGKEDKKYPTMPHVIFNYYRVRKTERKGHHFLRPL